MSKRMKRALAAMLGVVSIALVTGGVVWVVACLTSCDPTLTVPDTVTVGDDLLATSTSDHPPITITATVRGNHLPGSPDDGSGDPGGVNDASFSTVGLHAGDIIVVTASNALDQTTVKSVEVL